MTMLADLLDPIAGKGDAERRCGNPPSLLINDDAAVCALCVSGFASKKRDLEHPTRLAVQSPIEAATSHHCG
jgi:hypothetical protein